MRRARFSRGLTLAVCFGFGAFCVGLAALSVEAGDRTIGTIDRLDPRLDHLVPQDAVIEVLADGFKWSEGPVWDREQGRVLFSDIPNNTVHAWSDESGLEVFLKPSGYTGEAPFEGREPGSNGLAFDPKGRLVLCQHGDRRVARLEGETFVTLADRFDGQRFNSPNDLVYAADGALYFTDPPYGRPKTFEDPGREIGLVRRLPPRAGPTRCRSSSRT